MLKIATTMKFIFAVLFTCAHNVEALSLTSNFTIPQPLLTNLTNFNVVQEVLNSYGYADVASAITNLDVTLDMFNQIGELQNTADQLAAVDNMCFHQLLLYVDALNTMDEWALKMFDATAKTQSGILEGNTMHIGNFDECLKIDVVANGIQINGQYCTAIITDTIQNKPVKLSIKENLFLLKQSYGFCVPASCDRASLDGVSRLLEEALQSSYHLYFVEDLCISNVKTKPLSTMAIMSITFFTAVGFVVISSTIYDIYILKPREHQGPHLFTAFSFYTNGRKLFSTKRSADSLGCLNGMKVISIMWIVVGHRYMYAWLMPLVNLIDMMKWESMPASGLITGANMAVDTFFVISGALLVYVYLLHKEMGHNTPLIMFYIHRILRLTPALAAMVLFHAALLDYIGFGPFWPFISYIFQDDCEQNWWLTLLYIQNFVNTNAMCLRHSWYLAVDMQLYFLSPLLLIPLLKWPKRTLTVVASLIVVCCAIAFTISWQKNLPSAFFGISDDTMKNLYGAPHVRAPTWLTGILLGYILFKIRNKVIKINKVAQVLLWFSSLVVMTGILAYHKRLGETLYSPVRLESALANSLLKLAWAIAVSIIIFLCITGHGGPVNRFLSNPIFTVMIRINYSVYLVHMLVILFSLGNVQTPKYESHFDNFYYFWGDYTISSILAVVWTLCFESPIIILEKLMFAKAKSKREDRVESGRYNNNVSIVVIENNLENDLKSNKFCGSSES